MPVVQLDCMSRKYNRIIRFKKLSVGDAGEKHVIDSHQIFHSVPRLRSFQALNQHDCDVDGKAFHKATTNMNSHLSCLLRTYTMYI